ncbi:MAG: ribose 5-phosphate isomerase B [Candidatus Aenigmarchaeota archaeon]|nr:ribose 5-phosphate isomerase B [Candidatus Aenigmarchaeota archaeon]
MKIALASDHAGFELKEKIKKFLEELGYEYKDFGTHSNESVDYPDYALKVAESVAKKEFERGILICGSGIGMCMAANKVPGIRAALCHSTEMARLSREHNDANVLTMGARLTNEKTAKDVVRVWLTTEFAGERHLKRVNKMKDIEKKYSKYL